MAFGDGGIGIPAALHGLGGGRSDAEMIEFALQERVSSRPGGGGLGLTELARAVRAFGRHMVIRSGHGQVVVTPREQSRRTVGDRLPGTLVEIAW
jgi:hypothetical protein